MNGAALQCDCTACLQVSSGSGDIEEFRKACLRAGFFLLIIYRPGLIDLPDLLL